MSEESIRAVFYSYALDGKMTISGFFEFLVDADLIRNDWHHLRFLNLFESRATLNILEFPGFINFVKHLAQSSSKREIAALIDRVLTLETHQRLSTRKSGALCSGLETIKCMYSQPVLAAFEEVFSQVRKPVTVPTVGELFRARGFIPSLFVTAEYAEAAKLLCLRDSTILDFPAFAELLAVSILRAPPSLLPTPKLQADRIAECVAKFSSFTILKEVTKAAEVDPVVVFIDELETLLHALSPPPVVAVSHDNRLPPRGTPVDRVLGQIQFHEDSIGPDKITLPRNDSFSALVPIFLDTPQKVPEDFPGSSKELLIAAAVYRRERDVHASIRATLRARAELWQGTLGKVPHGFVATATEDFRLKSAASSIDILGPLIDDCRANKVNTWGSVQPINSDFSAEIFLHDAGSILSDVYFACEIASLLVSNAEPLKALVILRGVQKIVKDTDSTQQTAWWSAVGFALFFSDKETLALRSFLSARAAAEHCPDAIAAAYHNCGVCFHMLGRTEEARAFLSIAAELFPDRDPRQVNSKRLLTQCQGSTRCAPAIWTILEPGPPKKAKKAKAKKGKAKK